MESGKYLELFNVSCQGERLNPNSGNPNPNALTDDDLKALANADLTAKRLRDDQGGKQVRHTF